MKGALTFALAAGVGATVPHIGSQWLTSQPVAISRARPAILPSIGDQLANVSVLWDSEVRSIVDLRDADRLTVYIFFSTGCALSFAEARACDELTHRYEAEAILVPLAHVSSITTLTDFRYQAGVSRTPMGALVGFQDALAVGVEGFPQAFVVDPGGTLRFKTHGRNATLQIDTWLGSELGAPQPFVESAR